METKINQPEVKRISAVVINKIAQVASDDSTYAIVEANDLLGERVAICIGTKQAEKISDYVGKIVDVIYKDCIAGVTQYIEEDDIDEVVKTHTVTHKKVVDINKTNDVNLLIACVKCGLKDMYAELKSINS